MDREHSNPRTVWLTVCCNFTRLVGLILEFLAEQPLDPAVPGRCLVEERHVAVGRRHRPDRIVADMTGAGGVLVLDQLLLVLRVIGQVVLLISRGAGVAGAVLVEILLGPHAVLAVGAVGRPLPLSAPRRFSPPLCWRHAGRHDECEHQAETGTSDEQWKSVVCHLQNFNFVH